MDRPLHREGEAASPTSARDAGLRRLGRLRRWSVIGSLALAGAVAGLVAQAKPGKSSTTTATTARPAGGRTSGATHLPGGALVGGSSGASQSSPSSISPPPATPAPAPPTPSAPVSGGS